MFKQIREFFEFGTNLTLNEVRNAEKLNLFLTSQNDNDQSLLH